MYFKAIPIAERLPEAGKNVTTIDIDGVHRVFWVFSEGPEGQIWLLHDPKKTEVLEKYPKITHWLEETDISTIERKAERWDDLDAKISPLFMEDDENGEKIFGEIDGEEIEQIVATAFGFSS